MKLLRNASENAVKGLWQVQRWRRNGGKGAREETLGQEKERRRWRRRSQLRTHNTSLPSSLYHLLMAYSSSIRRLRQDAAHRRRSVCCFSPVSLSSFSRLTLSASSSTIDLSRGWLRPSYPVCILQRGFDFGWRASLDTKKKKPAGRFVSPRFSFRAVLFTFF